MISPFQLERPLSRAGTATAPRPRRWPLHPQPLADETPLSWLRRLAAAYRIDVDHFIAWYVGGCERMRLSAINLDMPSSIALALADGTGVPVGRIGSMALDQARHGTPSSFELLEARFDLLLDRVRDGVPAPQVCPQCIAEDKVPFVRRAWCLTISTSCPRHHRLLEERCVKCRAIVGTGYRGKGSRCDHPAIVPVNAASDFQDAIIRGLSAESVDLGWASIDVQQLAATLAIVDILLVACDASYQEWLRFQHLPYGSRWRRESIPINREPIEPRAHRLGHIAERLLNWPSFVSEVIVEDATGIISATSEPDWNGRPGNRHVRRILEWLEALPAPLVAPLCLLKQEGLRRFGSWLDRQIDLLFVSGWNDRLEAFMDKWRADQTKNTSEGFTRLP